MRVLLAFFVLVAVLAPVGAAKASSDVYPIVFPVAGENYYSDTWGAPRSGGRTHEGTDLMADKMIPVVAAASGTVGWMQNEQGGRCCAMELEHDDGWSTWYIHLNNDTPGTDDGQGWGFAPGIERGARVEAGQLIGWIGDSGNAEWVAPQLHFEIRRPDGTPMNPYPSLIAAESGGPPLPSSAEPSAPQPPGSITAYTDVPANSVFADDISFLADQGITVSCDGGERYCPDDPLTREHMAVLLARSLDLNVGLANPFNDDDGLTYEGEIGMIAAAGITLGCSETSYCPQDPVTRGQMAAFLVRAFNLTATMVNPFLDDEGSYFEDDIMRLAASGITLGCDPDDIRKFCPDQSVTRGQMAAFIARALRG